MVLKTEILALFPILGRKHLTFTLNVTAYGKFLVDLIKYFLKMFASMLFRSCGF